MKFTLNKIFFWLFGLIWSGLIIWNLLSPHSVFSENENRYLSDKPKFSYEDLINGNFMKKTDTYINDQFIMRDKWISLQSVLEYAIGKRENNDVFICNDTLIECLAETDTAVADRNVEGIKSFLNQFDIPSEIMLVPSASEILKDKLPLFAQPWNQSNMIADIYNKLPELNTISVNSMLEEHSSEYIYYRTDHHWTTYGAYLSYLEYCKATGLEPSEYEFETVSSSFNGTLYSSSGVRYINSDTIQAIKSDYFAGCDVYDGKDTKHYDSLYFDEYLSKKDKYAFFLGTNQPIVTIHGNNNTGKKLLMFKDSYAHCFAPMLLSAYDEITLVDLRYIKSGITELVNPENYDNVLFLYGIKTFTGQDDLSKLDYIFKQ